MALASRLARAAGATLTGVYVEDPSRFVYVPLLTAATSPILGDPSVMAPLPPGELLAEEERQEQEERELRSSFTEICQADALSGTFQILQGPVDDMLLERSRRVDLLVMGYDRGHAAAEGLLERVLRNSVRPVLVVSEDARVDGPTLVAYDGTPAAQRALAVAGALVAANAIKPISVVTVTDDADEARPLQEEARDYLSHYTPKVQGLVRVGDAVPGIVSTAEELKAGLIVMGAFGDPAVRELLDGSTTREVLAATPCAVLLVS
jgi:nucleotide-binding universal stress UspA family protein